MAKKDTSNTGPVALDTLYLVSDTSQPIVLEIITGGLGQTSTIDVKIIENTIVANGIQGHLPQTNIGTNKDLQGRILLITCNIADTSGEINYTELRVRLNGGIMFMEYPLFAEVKKEGDSIDYVCIIRFFKP